MIAGILRKIFGQSAPPAPPPPTPAAPVTQALGQQMAKARLTPKTSVWRLIEDNDAKRLGDAIAANPVALTKVKSIKVFKQTSVDMKPLHFAAYKGCEEALALLHQLGGDIDEKLPSAVTPLHLAAASKRGAVSVAYILSKSTANRDAQMVTGATPLTEAARNGCTACVEELLKAGADPEFYGNKAMPPLPAAAAGGHRETVEALIRHGARLEAAGANGRTALWNAVYAHNVPMTDFLIKAGADVKVTDINGETLLMTAARRGNMQLVQELIDRGFDVNQRDRNGSTAMHYTTYANGTGRAKEVADLLLKNGAYIDPVNAMAETPLSRARLMKPPFGEEMTTFLEARSDDPSVKRDPGFMTPFTEGTERKVRTLKVLKLKPASH